jgi:hypothetical protein
MALEKIFALQLELAHETFALQLKFVRRFLALQLKRKMMEINLGSGEMR